MTIKNKKNIIVTEVWIPVLFYHRRVKGVADAFPCVHVTTFFPDQNVKSLKNIMCLASVLRNKDFFSHHPFLRAMTVWRSKSCKTQRPSKVMELALLSMPLSCKTLVNQFGNREEIDIPLEESKFHDFFIFNVFIISLIISRRYKKKTIMVTEVWFRLFFIYYLTSYIKHSTQCFIQRPDTSNYQVGLLHSRLFLSRQATLLPRWHKD